MRWYNTTGLKRAHKERPIKPSCLICGKKRKLSPDYLCRECTRRKEASA